MNGPSQWLWGQAEAHTRRPTWRHTAVGYSIHHASSILWAILHEGVFCDSGRGSGVERDGVARKPLPQHVLEAALVASTAYFVDYVVTPKRLRPGFRKHLSPQSIWIVYGAFAAGLAATTISRARRRGRRVSPPA